MDGGGPGARPGRGSGTTRQAVTRSASSQAGSRWPSSTASDGTADLGRSLTRTPADRRPTASASARTGLMQPGSGRVRVQPSGGGTAEAPREADPLREVDVLVRDGDHCRVVQEDQEDEEGRPRRAPLVVARDAEPAIVLLPTPEQETRRTIPGEHRGPGDPSSPRRRAVRFGGRKADPRQRRQVGHPLAERFHLPPGEAAGALEGRGPRRLHQQGP